MKSKVTSIFPHFLMKNKINLSKKLFSNKVKIANVIPSNKCSLIFSTPKNNFFLKNSLKFFSSIINFTKKK